MSLPKPTDPDFWTQVMKLRQPTWCPVTEDDQFDLYDDIQAAVYR
ncbi:hypothetical protein ACFWMU_18440 [Streptomyces sp. NPDC058357]